MRKRRWIGLAVTGALGCAGCGEVEPRYEVQEQAATFGSLDVFKPSLMVDVVDGAQRDRSEYGRLWQLHRLARSVVNVQSREYVRPRNSPTAPYAYTAWGRGSGFLIGPNTMMTAYHVLETQRLMTHKGHSGLVWNQLEQLEDVELKVEGNLEFATEPASDDFMKRALRHRLAQMGLHQEAVLSDIEHLRSVPSSTVIEEFVNVDKVMACRAPSYDIALVKVPRVPLLAETILDKKVPFLPVGALYDWFPLPLDPNGGIDNKRMPSTQPNTADGERLASIHINHLATEKNDTRGRGEYHTLVSLPAPRELMPQGNHCSTIERCCATPRCNDNSDTRYEACHGADIDLLSGSSGGAIMLFQPNGRMSTVGAAQASPNPNTHWEESNPSFRVDENDGRATRFTRIQDFMYHNADLGQATLEPSPPPKVTDSPQECQGGCEDISSLVKVWCRDSFEDGHDRPMIGLLGSPDGVGERLGAIAAVCGRNTPKPYTDTWGGLRTLGIPRHKSMGWAFPDIPGSGLMTALRRAHVRRPRTNGNNTQAEPLPMQLCRPDQLLVGLQMRTQNKEIRNIEALYCRTRDNIEAGSPGDPEVIPVEVQVNLPQDSYLLAQHLGGLGDDPQADVAHSQCPTGEAMVGFAAHDQTGRGDSVTTSLALLCGTLGR